MGKNIQTVQFLRNGDIFASRELAENGLKNLATSSIYDGMMALGRYTNASGQIATLVGVYAVSGTTGSVTIIDVEGSAADVKALREEINAKLGSGVTSANTVTMQLTALSGNGASTSAETSVEGAKRYADELKNQMDYSGVTTGDGVYVTNVTQSDGIVSATTATLPTVSAISEAGKPITAVSENLGAISATAGTINAEFVNIADGGEKFTATTVEGALAEIATEIDAMDLAVVSGDGEVITAVSEQDGKVSASKTAIKDVKLTGYVKNTAATGAISATDDVEDALSKLENTISSNEITNADGSITVTPANGSTTDIKVHIKDGEKVIKLDANQGGIYTDIKIASATPSSTTVKEEYNLLDSDGNALGASIKIYKDSHIVSITYITDSGDTHYQNLEYRYIDADGNEQVEYVDISSLVLEAEFASGVTATDHVVHGVVDSTSETFLTVGTNGFKLSGVQDAINAAVNGLDSTVSNSGNSGHVGVEIVEEDGKLVSVTVTENDIASVDDIEGLSAKTVTEIGSSNNSISAISDSTTDGTVKYDIVTDADKIQMSGFSADSASSLSGILESDSIATAFEKTNTVITDNERVTAEALTDLDNRINELSSSTTQELDKEIAARKAVDGISAQTYQATSTANYISGATSLNDADQKLDAQLKVVSDEYVSGATMNDATITISNKVLTFSAVGSDSAGNGNGIVITTDNNGGLTFALGTLDAGTY